MLPQLFPRVPARRHRQRLRPDGAGALDVARRVADDQDFLAAQRRAEPPVPPDVGDAGQLIAILVIVAERAQRKEPPKPVMTQLDLCAEEDVTREQADHGRMPQGLQVTNPFCHTGQHPAVELPEQMVQVKDVTVEEPPEIVRARLDAMVLEKIAYNGGIRAPGKVQTRGAVPHAELGVAHLPEGLLPGAAAGDQRPVDVE